MFQNRFQHFVTIEKHKEVTTILTATLASEVVQFCSNSYFMETKENNVTIMVLLDERLNRFRLYQINGMKFVLNDHFSWSISINANDLRCSVLGASFFPIFINNLHDVISTLYLCRWHNNVLIVTLVGSIKLNL